MILVFTRVFRDPDQREWPYGDAYLVGFTSRGERLLDEAVVARINEIKLVYIHNRCLGMPVFKRMMNGIPATATAIAHPGGGSKHLVDVIGKLKSLVPGVNFDSMLKSEYSVHGNEGDLAVIVADNFRDEAAFSAHLNGLASFLREKTANRTSLDISALRHRIGEILLPLDVDLQALETLWYAGDLQGSEDYFCKYYKGEKFVARAKAIIDASNVIAKSPLMGKRVLLELFELKTADGKEVLFDALNFQLLQPAEVGVFVAYYAPGDKKQHVNLFHKWFKKLMKEIC